MNHGLSINLLVRGQIKEADRVDNLVSPQRTEWITRQRLLNATVKYTDFQLEN